MQHNTYHSSQVQTVLNILLVNFPLQYRFSVSKRTYNYTHPQSDTNHIVYPTPLPYIYPPSSMQIYRTSTPSELFDDQSERTLYFCLHLAVDWVADASWTSTHLSSLEAWNPTDKLSAYTLSSKRLPKSSFVQRSNIKQNSLHLQTLNPWRCKQIMKSIFSQASKTVTSSLCILVFAWIANFVIKGWRAQRNCIRLKRENLVR